MIMRLAAEKELGREKCRLPAILQSVCFMRYHDATELKTMANRVVVTWLLETWHNIGQRAMTIFM